MIRNKTYQQEALSRIRGSKCRQQEAYLSGSQCGGFILWTQFQYFYYPIYTSSMSLSDFKIITKLGTGAYSSVYQVQRILDNQIYALKKVNLAGLNEKEKQNSLNEIRILASLRHPNVIGYREAFFDETTKSLCIVMEYADNGDLYQKIVDKTNAGQAFSEAEVWQTFIQIVKGLKILHDRKILHRDLKSANVFLWKDGRAKLGDMNVSKISEKGLCQTQTGTPYYASPQVWKDEPYGPKSDIWSLGCVMYEMMALRPPFQADDMEGLYKKVIKGEYPKLPLRYSSDLNDLIRILLQTDPFKRPSCQKILGMKMIVKRFPEENQKNIPENPEFLRTIRMPKNIEVLTENLPKPNYFSSKKELKYQKSRIIANQTEKLQKKSLQISKNKLFPKLHSREVYTHNKSLLLKNTSIVEAARNQVETNIRLNAQRDGIKKRDRKLKREKTKEELQEQIKPKRTIDLQEKITQIQKIYGDHQKLAKRVNL